MSRALFIEWLSQRLRDDPADRDAGLLLSVSLREPLVVSDRERERLEALAGHVRSLPTTADFIIAGVAVWLLQRLDEP